jgi:hypothetical protein
MAQVGPNVAPPLDPGETLDLVFSTTIVCAWLPSCVRRVATFAVLGLRVKTPDLAVLVTVVCASLPSWRRHRGVQIPLGLASLSLQVFAFLVPFFNL